MAGQGEDGASRKGIVRRLAKLFSNKKVLDSNHKVDKLERKAIYLGDVFNDNGSVVCEAGPLPIDLRTSQMVEKYRQEARNAQQQQPEAGAEGQTASTSQSGSRERVPLYKKAIPSFPSSISEIQPDGTLPVQPQGHAVRVPEDGIAEVLDDRAIRHKHGHSPLSTFSSFHEMCAPQHTNGASKPQQTDHRNVHLLDAPGASTELQPNTAAVKSRFLQQQCNLQPPAINSGAAEEWVPISDTWGSTLFGSPQKAAEAGSKQKGLAGPLGHLHSTVNEVGHSLQADGRSPTSKKRPQSILTSGSSTSKLSSPESSSAQKAPVRSPVKQHRNLAWASGTRSRKHDVDGKKDPERALSSSDVEKQDHRRGGCLSQAAGEPSKGWGARAHAVDADPDVRRVAEAFNKQTASQKLGSCPVPRVHHLRLPQPAHDSWQGGRNESCHPRQQRREARQREKEKTLLQLQEQALDKQRQAQVGGRPRTAKDLRLRTQPLQDVTSTQGNATAIDRRAALFSQPAGPKPSQRVLGGKYLDVDASLASRLDAYSGVPNLMDDISPDDAPPGSAFDEMQYRSRPLRRVHFPDEQAQPNHHLLAAVDVSDIRSRHKAAPKAGRALKSSQRQPSATADGDRPISFWTEENDEDVLAEAMALSASLNRLEEPNAPGGPLLSPSRFLQLASQPTENQDLPSNSRVPAWDAQVSIQMEFAKSLSEKRQIQQQKAPNRKLQCVSDGLPEADASASLQLLDVRQQPKQQEEAPSSELAVVPSDVSLPDHGHRAKRRSRRLPAHQATHSSTTMLMKAAAAKDTTGEALVPAQGRVQNSFVAARRAILQSEARQLPVLTSSKTGPLWTAPADWDQSTVTGCMPEEELRGYPVSIPASPGSMASLHGHALSHVTYSPSKYSGSVWSSYHDEPWAPEMQAVAEDEEGEAVDAKTLAEMSALSFRPGLTTEPVTRLTQATLETRAVLDTVACDVDLALLRSIWPAGHTPASTHRFALDSGRLSVPKNHPDAECVYTPSCSSRLLRKSAVATSHADFVYSRNATGRPTNWG